MIDGLQLLQNSMMDYGTAVNEDRAIPDARTGLKPIHLKILYEMWIDKVRSSGRYQKNAKMVGAIIARFSEHGDTSAYDALVRLGQDWIQNYPLIDFHGNNGSIFGDGPGAFRYTESRLAEIAEEGYLQNLDTALPKKYWGLNFTEEEPEPLTLPALFPGLFCLPNQGIGYGVACNFLPYNLADIYTIVEEYLNGAEDISTIYYDLPTGGTFVNPSVMKDIYLIGKGSVIIESKYEIEKDKIIITEVPWNIEVDKLLDKLYSFTSDEMAGVKEVSNESGNNKLRIVITCKSGCKPQDVLDYLFSKSDLRKSYGVNQNALKGDKPVAMNMYDMVATYVDHNLECLQTEYENEKEKLEARIHILQGLLVALGHIDEVIDIIRHQDKPKEILMEKMNLTSAQVDAILKMTLNRLSKLEEEKLINEKKEKQTRLTIVMTFLANENQEQETELLRRLKVLVNKYAQPRRTVIEEKKIKKITSSKKKVEEIPTECMIALDKNGYLKRLSLSKAKSNSTDINSFKCMTNDMLALFSSLGRVFRIQAKDIKENSSVSEKGSAAGAVVKLKDGETILNIFAPGVDNKHPYIAFFTKNGLVKKTKKETYLGATRNLNGLQATGINEGDTLIGIYETNGDIAEVLSTDNHIIYFMMDSIRESGKTAKGVKAIALSDGQTVKSAKIVQEKDVKTKVQNRGGKGQTI